MPLPRIAIPLGDPAGIGPEIALKAALSDAVRAACVPVLVGDRGALETHAAACGLEARILEINPAQARDLELPAGSIALIARRQLTPGQLKLGKVDAMHGRAVLDSLAVAVNAAIAGEVDAVAAAPATDRAVHAAGVQFDGYTGFAAAVADVPRGTSFLMLCAGNTRVVHATGHVSVRQALAQVTPARVDTVIATTEAALKAMGISAPRIAVSGLNPHAGEEGQFGIEEATIIGPAIARAQKAGVRAEGPFDIGELFDVPADAHIVMLHDQAQAAASRLPRDATIALSLGLPQPFASVAHGSALDIAGRNRADPAALVAAILHGAAAAQAQRQALAPQPANA